MDTLPYLPHIGVAEARATTAKRCSILVPVAESSPLTLRLPAMEGDRALVLVDHVTPPPAAPAGAEGSLGPSGNKSDRWADMASDASGSDAASVTDLYEGFSSPLIDGCTGESITHTMARFTKSLGVRYRDSAEEGFRKIEATLSPHYSSGTPSSVGVT